MPGGGEWGVAGSETDETERSAKYTVILVKIIIQSLRFLSFESLQ